MTKQPLQIGRLAMRVEGKMWSAYYAQADTMKGAIFLGSIAMRFVSDIERKRAFMALMREAVSDLIEELTGIRPIWPDPDGATAPAHERPGQA